MKYIVRDMTCRGCNESTSGDCGVHGPRIYFGTNTSDQEVDALRARLAEVERERDEARRSLGIVEGHARDERARVQAVLARVVEAEQQRDDQKDDANVAWEACWAAQRGEDQANAKIQALTAALAEIIALIEEGRLVRDTSADADTPTYLRQSVRLVKALSNAKAALDAARGGT